MNPLSNTKIRAKNPKRQSANDASAGSCTALTRFQSKSDFPGFILIKNKGECPRGCSRISGSSFRLNPDINRNAGKGKRINNNEEIYTTKANFIF